MSSAEGDRRLLDRLAAGEPEAFARLYDLYGARLYRTALGFLRRPDAAEDAVQDLFVALVRSQSSLRTVENLPAYLFSSLYRRLQRTPSGPRIGPTAELDQTTDPQPGPLHQACDQEARLRLAAAVRRLPDQQREVLTLKVEGELTFAEIGSVLEVSPNTAASRYRYALDRLRELLSERNHAASQPRNDA